MDYKLIKELKFPEQIYDARYHPNHEGNLIAATSIDGNLYLIEGSEIKSKIRKHHKGSAIRKVRFDRDGRLVTIAKTVKIYDLDSSQTVHTLKRNDEKPPSLYSVLPVGASMICAGDDDGSVFVWDVRTPDKPVFLSSDCEQYISDIDSKCDSARLIVCTSGEGTLTAYDLRANKMIEPQSELFETGFQCVKLVELNKKVVIGGEDGSIYVFNQNEWAHTSGKFAVGDDSRNRGKCSIDSIESIPDSQIFIAACSDGRMRSLTLWPHRLLSENIFCRRSPLESIHVNPNKNNQELVVTGENYIDIVGYTEKSEESASENDSSDNAENSPADNSSANDETNAQHDDAKRPKTNNDDYLNVFN